MDKSKNNNNDQNLNFYPDPQSDLGNNSNQFENPSMFDELNPPDSFTTYNAFDEQANFEPMPQNNLGNDLENNYEYEPMNNMQNNYEPMNNMQNSYEPMNNMQNSYEPMSNMQNSYEPMNNMQNSYEPINNMQNNYEPMNNMQNDYEPMPNNPNNYDNQAYDDNSDYNMAFIQAWMGNLYNKAHSKKFSWPAAFFGGIYFLFRKMYMTGFLFIVLSLLITCSPMFLLTKVNPLILLPVVGIASLTLFFVCGFTFYPLYRSFARKKLNKYKNSITDNSELINTASKKGKTSIIAVLIALIVVPIVTGTILSFTVLSDLNNLLSKLPNHNNQNTTDDNTISEPVTDIQTFNFLNQYAIEYDALSWFLNASTNTLTKGNYNLLYTGQYLENLNSSLNTDITTPPGRADLLNILVSSLQAQAAAVNLTVETGTSNFVSGTNAYYAYLDVIATDNVSRYYFILLPEKDILFQFVLTTNDTTIDYATGLEVINILTSISEQEPTQNNNDTNTLDSNTTSAENMITDTNTISDSQNIVDAGSASNSTSENEVAQNSISSGNTTVETNTTGNATNLNSILN